MTGEANRAEFFCQVHLKVWRDKTKEVSWRPQDFRMDMIWHHFMDIPDIAIKASYEVCMDGLWFMDVDGL